jgi:hypothetical protein
MTLAKDERMLDEWKRCQSENAALWAFVREWDTYDLHDDVWPEQLAEVDAAREALRQYEEKP